MSDSARHGDLLPVPGGYDADGELTRDPAAIKASKRALPIGYWKGSGLAILLDLIAALLSGGRTSAQISREATEYAVSQVFIAFDVGRTPLGDQAERIVSAVIDDLHRMEAVDGGSIRYPGENTLRIRHENMAHGVPVDPEIWQQVLEL
jgi:3-dehydro-L-gulonate 2-dehydrogenase